MFENPNALLLLVLVPAMAAVFYWRTRVRRRALARIGDSALVESLAASVIPRRRAWKSTLWLVALAMLIVALAQPVFGIEADIVETRGIAVVLVIDVSTSMDAQDVLPSRLDSAKLAARQLLAGGVGSQFGLVLFAGDAFVQFPLTSDLDTAASFVDAASSASITRQGTVVADALQLALETFDERITSDSVIVLFSDGESHTGDTSAAVEAAVERGVTIHVIGYGTEEGALIPVTDENGEVTGYKTDEAQNLVSTRIDEPFLQAIAEATGGLYQRATGSGIEVVNIQNALAALEGQVFDTRLQTRNVQRFGIFVALALLALTVEMLLPETRREGSNATR